MATSPPRDVLTAQLDELGLGNRCASPDADDGVFSAEPEALFDVSRAPASCLAADRPEPDSACALALRLQRSALTPPRVSPRSRKPTR